MGLLLSLSCPYSAMRGLSSELCGSKRLPSVHEAAGEHIFLKQGKIAGALCKKPTNLRCVIFSSLRFFSSDFVPRLRKSIAYNAGSNCGAPEAATRDQAG